jgi:hypothetical protein
MMHPPSQCPQCAAPLPQGAPKCGFCGVPTPWGAAFAAQQNQAAHLQADREKRVRIARAESTAKTGMILALVGLPICCGPLALVGGALGWRGGQAARAEGAPRPVTSVIAMIVAGVSALTFCIAIVLFIRDQQARAHHLTEVQARLAGKREGPALEAKVACDLVEEYLVQNGHGGKQFDIDKAVHCDGALTVTERRAAAPDVRFAMATTYSTVNACFERRSRWFVLKLLDGGSCADLPPPAAFTAPPRQLSDEEVLADEKKAREDLDKAAGALVLKALVDHLARVKANAATGGGAEKQCAKADLAALLTGPERRKVSTLDFDLLNGSSAGQSWPFLSSDTLEKILDDKRSAADRAKSAEQLRSESGPLLVVYKADHKLWPVVNGKSEVAGKDFSYDGGEYSGWLLVYHLDSGERLCQTRLAFESSDAVDFKKGRLASEKSSAKEAIENDFRDQFEIAATAAIKRAAPDLRLGYKVIE